MDEPIINIENMSNAVEITEREILDVMNFVAAAEGKTLSQVDLLITDSQTMTEMNEQYLSHEGDTDVITFDLTDPGDEGISVQLIVCDTVAIRQGRDNDMPQKHELLLYIIHGLLHTMGYDDKSPDKFEAMHARQSELLEEFLSQS